MGNLASSRCCLLAPTRPLPHSPALPLTLACLLLIGIFTAPCAHAQQQADTTQPALPDLAPREFEIRGQLELSLPSLERQPLKGFATPFAPPAAPGSRPYVTEYRRAGTSPDALPERGEAARLSPLPPSATGVFKAAGGRYFSRMGAARLTLPLSEREALAFRLDYRGSSGFSPFEDRPAVDTPFDALNGTLDISTHRGSFTAGLALNGFLQTYTLYGARTAGSFQSPRGTFPQPNRRGLGGSGTLRLRFGGTVPVGLRATYAEARYALNRFEDDETWDTHSTERRLAFAADTRIPVAGRPLTADARVTLSSNESGRSLTSGGTTVDGGIAYRLLSGPAYNVTVGAQAMAFSTSEDAVLYASPVVRLNWYPQPFLIIFAQNTPGLEAHALTDLFEENPYLTPHPRTAPTIRLIDAEGGVQLFAGPFQFTARAGLRRMPRYLYFERGRLEGYARGFTMARYAEARVLHAGATVALSSRSGWHASVGVSARRGRLLENDTTIPYFSPLRGQALLSYAFPGDRGLVQLTGTFIGARYAGHSETARVDPFLDLDAKLTYNLTTAVGVMLRVENMSFANEHWRHYPQPPFAVMTGLRIRW